MSGWVPMEAGTTLREQYEVEKRVGRGGFGATYRARDRLCFGRVCALKELLPQEATVAAKVHELFKQEAWMLNELRHPSIPALYEYFAHEGRYYLVEEFIEGGTLEEEGVRRGAFPEPEVVRVLEEVLVVLEYLHGRSPAVIHRDIKPQNLMRAEGSHIYLIDFGAVKQAMVGNAVTPALTGLYTPGFTPPEQLGGQVVPASDLYALGVTAVCLASGRQPGEWHDTAAGRWRLVGRLGFDPRLEALLERLVEQDYTRRLPTATAALAALREATARGPRSAAPPTGRPWAPLSIATVLRARYEVTAVEGGGRACIEYHGIDRGGLGRPCVVLEFRAPLPPALEAELGRLDLAHPALARVLGCFPDGDRHYFVQELIKAPTLATILRDEGPLDEDHVVDVLRAALAALVHVHQQVPPVVHGALRPASILVAGRGAVVLTGFAVLLRAVADDPAAAAAAATATPEPASDLAALGATALELLTGQPPDRADAARDLERLPVSAGLRRVLGRLLDPTPGARYATAAEASADLDQLPKRTLPTPPLPPSLRPTLPRPVKAMPIVPIGIAAVLLAVFAIWTMSGREGSEPAPARTPAPQPAPPLPQQPSTGIPGRTRLSARAEPDGGPAPLAVQFTVEPQGNNGRENHFEWSFGDGEGSREQHPRHVYRRPGSYTVVVEAKEVLPRTDPLGALVGAHQQGHTVLEVHVASPGG